MKTLYLKVKYETVVSRFPSFSATGSIVGMKKQFYGENAMLVRCGSFIYNVDFNTYHDIANKYKYP